MRWLITVKRFTYSDSLLRPEESKKDRDWSFFQFVNFSSSSWRNPMLPKTCQKPSVVCMLQVMNRCSWCSFVLDLRPESRWCQSAICWSLWLAESKRVCVFSVVWRKNLDKVSGTRRKNCQLLCGKSVQNPGEFLWVYISFVKHLRAYIKRLEKLDDNTSTVYPIS